MSESQGALKIGVLISGSGSNLQAIIDRIDQGTLDAEIVLVISSRPDAFGLTRAEKAGIPTLALNREVYQDAPAANKRIADALKEAGAEYVIMAGYMRKLTNEVLDAYPDKVVNLHPALLPSFKGAHAIEDAFTFGVKVTGITVHFANEDYDKGPIIAQRAVEIREDDTLESLETRIHEAEHALYPEVISWLAAGRVQIDEETRTVHIASSN
ncbi:phosphoribosylglycinamide formyltransferase [Cryptobacterium sp. CAG:338]|nr:phosphoribosylglycinamide formyltransferase [Cryptobacterium sp. CAG:338]